MGVLMFFPFLYQDSYSLRVMKDKMPTTNSTKTLQSERIAVVLEVWKGETKVL